MKAKKILVTGGAGYIGSHTVVALHEAGYEPVILDNFSNSDRGVLSQLRRITGRSVRCYTGDCVKSADFAKIFKKEGRFHGIIHFAALKAVEESVTEPLRYYRNNLDSMMTVLDMMEKYRVPHLVFSSSCTVYGEPDKLPVGEDAPLKKAESPYGDTKQIAERMIEALIRTGSPVKAVSLRYFNPIGAHESGRIGELPLGKPRNLVPYVTQTAAGILKRLKVFGTDYGTPDGTCIRDYIHVMDLAAAHVCALDYLEKKSGKNFYDVVNIGTGRGNSVLEIIETFEKVTGVKVPHEMGPRRLGDIEQIYAANGKAKKELGWIAKRSLDDALRSAWAWQKNISKLKKMNAHAR